MKTTIYTHDSGLDHDTGHSHPERADRLKTLHELFEEEPFKSLPRGAVKPASEEQLMLGHPWSYIRKIEEAIPDKGHAGIDADTILSPKSWDAALYAAGAVCNAVDDIVARKTIRAFCANRPPGHHAEPETSMGFCIFGNIFIGARHAQEAHGFEKIAIVDFDVHHGNGTDAMTRRHDGTILFVSTHQYPLWPMTGLEIDNDDSVLNFVLPPDTGSEFFRNLYERKIFPAIDKFAPDLIMMSAGFDAHRADPLAQINLEAEDFGWVTQRLCELADKHAGGRVVSVLEGGYDLDALKDSAREHLKALVGL